MDDLDTPRLPVAIDEKAFWIDLDDALTPFQLTDAIRARVVGLLEDFAHSEPQRTITIRPNDDISDAHVELRISDVRRCQHLHMEARELAKRLIAVEAALNALYSERWDGTDECPPRWPASSERPSAVLNELVAECDGFVERSESYEEFFRLIDGDGTGRKRDARRDLLVWRILWLLHWQQIPLARSDDGVLARVLRVVLAAADTVEGKPVQGRKYLKDRIGEWLDRFEIEKAGGLFHLGE